MNAKKLNATSVVYVKNTQDYAYELQVRKNKMVVFAKVFQPKTLDENGKILHTGYTVLTAEELKQLETGTRFNSYIAKGLFEVMEEAPEEALTDDTKYQRLAAELEQAKLQLSETSSAALLKQIEALKAENEALKAGSTSVKTEIKTGKAATAKAKE